MCGNQNEKQRLVNAGDGVFASPSFSSSENPKDGYCGGNAVLKALRCFPKIEFTGSTQQFVYICWHPKDA